MRIDKYLKITRIIKRRTIANEACEAGRVLINDKVAKSGTQVKVGDIVEIRFGNNTTKFEVMEVKEHVRKEEVANLYRMM